MFFCHDMLTTAMLEAEAGRCDVSISGAEPMLLHGGQPPPRIRPGRPILAPCVDSANLLFWGGAGARESISRLCDVLRGMGEGLSVHDPGLALRVVDFVVLRIRGPG